MLSLLQFAQLKLRQKQKLMRNSMQNSSGKPQTRPTILLRFRIQPSNQQHDPASSFPQISGLRHHTCFGAPLETDPAQAHISPRHLLR